MLLSIQKRKWVLLLVLLSTSLFAQSWVKVRKGAGSNDTGTRTKAIIMREDLNMLAAAGQTYNHPSSMCETKEGTLIYIWNGGLAEAENGNRVWYSRKPKGGQWSTPKKMQDDKQIDVGIVYQPIYKNPTGRIYTSYWWGGPPKRSKGRLQYSDDDGKTWSTPVFMPTEPSGYWEKNNGGIYQHGEHHPFEWPDGTLWYPSGNEYASDAHGFHPAIVKVPPNNRMGNEPGGDSWKLQIISKQLQAGESHPSIVAMSPDSNQLLMTARARKGSPQHWISKDRGKTWQPKGKLMNTGGVTIAPVAIDAGGGPGQGWFAIAGSQGGRGRDYCAVSITNNPEANSWERVLELSKGGQEDGHMKMFQSRIDRTLHLIFSARGGDKLIHYNLDPYKLCGINGTVKAAQSKDTGMGMRTPVALAGNTIRLNVAKNGSTPVTISLYNAHGKQLVQSVYNNLGAGQHTVPISQIAENVACGSYIVKVAIGKEIQCMQLAWKK